MKCHKCKTEQDPDELYNTIIDLPSTAPYKKTSLYCKLCYDCWSKRNSRPRMNVEIYDTETD